MRWLPEGIQAHRSTQAHRSMRWLPEGIHRVPAFELIVESVVLPMLQDPI